MSHSLGVSVIAEGVETELQRNFLLSHRCEQFQGFLFGKPLPLEEWDTELLANAITPTERLLS
jgi:EAL domain-containing protein (putative c-di-GMP-specific phosphodiesterase class I)